MNQQKLDEDKALMLPLEDYLMIHYGATKEGTTPASLVNSWLLGHLDAKKNEEKK